MLFLEIGNELEERGHFVFSEGCYLLRILTMTRKVGDQTSEANGAETLRYGEVMFLAAGVTVEQENGGGFLVCGDLAIMKLFSKNSAFFAGDIETKTEKVGSAVRCRMGSNRHAVFGGFGENLMVNFSEARSFWRDDSIAGGLNENDADEKDDNEGDGDETAFHWFWRGRRGDSRFFMKT